MNVAEFRAGVCAWLADHDLSPGPDHSLDGQVAQLARVRRALFDAGWIRYGWPVEVGGLGGPAALRAVLGEEVATRDLAEPGIYSMIEVLAPTMISYARPPLAAEMVPLLLSGREQWCQGFSEPGSGSDLASLTTRAVPVKGGGEWVVTGQKVWTSLAQYSARCVLLTRTAPGHGGITAFFVDMDTPGITVRPLRTMHGVDEFAEVFFDDVVVPGDRLLGRPGDGRLAETLVAIEGAEAALLAAGDAGAGASDGDGAGVADGVGDGAGAGAGAGAGDKSLSCLLAKAAAGHAALTAARHCQQVLGGIGFTAEHGLHRHVRRALVLDGLLGSSAELTREVGVLLRKEGSARRLVQLW